MCVTKLCGTVLMYCAMLFQVVNGYISIPQVDPSAGKDATSLCQVKHNLWHFLTLCTNIQNSLDIFSLDYRIS